MEDRKETFENSRDLIEYHASFIEPEAVRKIRESRNESVEIPHEEFTAGIEYLFGRKIPIEKERKRGIESHNVSPNISANMSKLYKDQQKTSLTKQPIDYKHWLNFELE